MSDRHSHDEDDVHLLCFSQQARECLFGLIEEKCLLEQVLTAVGCDGEFGEHDNLDALCVGLPDERCNLLAVETAIGHPDLRDGRCYFYKSVIHLS